MLQLFLLGGGGEWKNKQVLLYSDNLALCMVWRSGTSKDEKIMHYLRPLFLFVAKLNINLLIKHIAGYNNVKADLLSRLQVHRFKEIHPTAQLEPTQVNKIIWTI